MVTLADKEEYITRKIMEFGYDIEKASILKIYGAVSMDDVDIASYLATERGLESAEHLALVLANKASLGALG